MTTTVFPLSALMSDSAYVAKHLYRMIVVASISVPSSLISCGTIKYGGGVFWLSEGMSYSESYSIWYILIISKQKTRFRIISYLWVHWLVLKSHLNTSIEDIYYSYFCSPWDKPKEERERQNMWHRPDKWASTNDCVLINNTPVFRSQQMKNKPYLKAQYASTDLWTCAVHS